MSTDLPQDDHGHDENLLTNKRKRDRRPLKKKSIFEEYMPPEVAEAMKGIKHVRPEYSEEQLKQGQ